MGVLINHARHARVNGLVNRPTSIPIRTPTCKKITEVLQSKAWLDQKVLILGGGPSMMGIKPDELPPSLKIGINKAFTEYQTNVNYAMDIQLHDALSYPQKHDPGNPALRQKWASFSGIKLFLRLESSTKFSPDVYVVDNLHKTISYDLSAGIYGGKNSGFGAMMLAIALGCNRIGLLGYDMKVDGSRKRTHWHNGYWHQTVRSIDEELKSMQDKLNKFREEFEEFADAIKQGGISVFNLNKDSALQCFPKITMNDFVSM